MSADHRSGTAPLPPAVTRIAPLAPAETGETMLPPFVAGAHARAGAAGPAPAETAAEPDALGGAAVEAEEDAFPLDAFIIPEDARRVPAGVAAGGAHPAPDDPALAVAERLERIARRIREDGAAAVGDLAASPDRLDAIIAGVLGGYLAARDA